MPTMTAQARKTDLVSSHEAAASVKVAPKAMLLLKAFSTRSMTAEEAANYVSTASNYLTYVPGYWKRVSDLLKEGLIEHRATASGGPLFRLNQSGRKAAVWRITPEGRAVLRELKNKSN